jgi:hypothetical protein
MDTETLTNAYILARMADCASPDSQESPGAVWLRRVASDLDELLEAIAGGAEPSDSVFEFVDQALPIYTHELWKVWVDLAGYNLSDQAAEEWGIGENASMEDRARIGLLFCAEGLLMALLDDAAEDASGDDEEGG